MILFDKTNYPRIRDACSNKIEIEFVVPAEITVFSSNSVPNEWTSYPPCLLPAEGYAKVIQYAGNDIKGTLTRLEVLVFLDGGRIEYKSLGNNQVALRVTWPMVNNSR